MAYVITEPCVGVKDGACVAVCPVDCIQGNESDAQLFIDPDVCIDCAACTSVCPVNAIYEASEVPAKWQSFIQVNRDYFAPPA
jgi:ferredoxin